MLEVCTSDVEKDFESDVQTPVSIARTHGSVVTVTCPSLLPLNARSHLIPHYHFPMFLSTRTPLSSLTPLIPLTNLIRLAASVLIIPTTPSSNYPPHPTLLSLASSPRQRLSSRG